ncbi:DUF4382 domain-containing protein [Leeuwenhoekiella marinoflava]|uniref:DUF4382 domain-containing protein n=2 Tax=Leeuwenhoekiella marinoflava TaxID=988 RepID=A0A4Q0PSY1_9FLAO|nr:DUF4382 domain-containing protein [Leeuwenhoekiella marinoflava]RXG33095.1 putative protein DUF4382 [Leeuwenhoekiella marinoflava]SHE38254.1 protein of unknown function [Leeuwenhoekiella marinoflava DSM 3653]
MKNTFKYGLLLAGILGLSSCSDDDANSSSERGTSKVAVRLVDAPGDYDNVFIDVKAVVVKYNDDFIDDEFDDDYMIVNGELELDTDDEIYDLLELTGGTYAILADEDIPAGSISQVRLILGDDNTVVVDGETFPLQTPSAQQSGLKVQFNQTLEAGVVYTVVLDFNVEESIVEQGNGGYLLKPVLRASAIEATGMISGSLLPLNVHATITAAGEGIVVSTNVSSNGDFVLNGLPEGVYDLTIDAELVADVITSITIEEVAVVNGETTVLERITVE